MVPTMPLKRAGAGTTQHCSHVCTIQICKIHLTIQLVCRHRENRKCTFSWPLVWNLSKKLNLWEYYTLEFNSKEKEINQWVWVCTPGSFIQVGKRYVSFSSYLSLFFSLFLFLPFKKINFKMKMTFWNETF